MLRTLTNISSAVVVLNDLSGKVVQPGESFDGLCFGSDVLRDSTAVQLALLNNELKLSDGTNEFFTQAAVDLIRGYAVQVTRDGKQIMTMSDRPKDHFRCFAGRGDDVTNTPKRIGLGPVLKLTAEPNAYDTVEAHFVDNVYIRDGSVQFLNCGFDTSLTIDIVCPPNVPFPSPTRVGTLDLIDGQFVPNASHTGGYMTAQMEIVLFRFVNSLPLIGSGSQEVTSPEPFLLNSPYFMRFRLYNGADAVETARAAINLGLFRAKTL